MAREGLTPKQEKFAQGVADGKTLADAYRGAYNTSRSTDKSVWELAARMMADIKVASRVKQLRDAMAERALWKREDSVRVLKEIAEGGDKDADRVRATAELNSMHGYDAPKKIEHGGAGVGVLVINIGGKALDPDALGW